jgi:hypothetical protein
MQISKKAKNQLLCNTPLLLNKLEELTNQLGKIKINIEKHNYVNFTSYLKDFKFVQSCLDSLSSYNSTEDSNLEDSLMRTYTNRY